MKINLHLILTFMHPQKVNVEKLVEKKSCNWGNLSLFPQKLLWWLLKNSSSSSSPLSQLNLLHIFSTMGDPLEK